MAVVQASTVAAAGADQLDGASDYVIVHCNRVTYTVSVRTVRKTDSLQFLIFQYAPVSQNALAAQGLPAQWLRWHGHGAAPPTAASLADAATQARCAG